MNNKEAEEESWEQIERGEIKEQSQKISSFFNRFSDFFENDAKKAIFLQGALTQILLNIQHKQRGTAQLKADLGRVNLDEKEIKKLFPRIQMRLEDYGEKHNTLATIISKYFVTAGSDWGVTQEEISFCFQLGMNLSYLFSQEDA